MDYHSHSSRHLAMRIKSRYADIDGVHIDLMKIPGVFHNMIELAKYWSVGDDVERNELLLCTSAMELNALIDNVYPYVDDIWKWCAKHHEDVPVMDEVVIFDMLLQTVAEARILLQSKA